MIRLDFQRGIELTDHGVWLDPRERKPFAFVSHAHSDHTGRHDEIVASPVTAALVRARLGGQRTMHELAFGEPVSMRGLRLTLLPAGHIFGSAQIFLESENETLLYTGDFKLRASLAAEPLQWRRADTLIMETTFGLPKYRMPPSAQVLADIAAFCRAAFADGATPVLLAYSLGKAQEIHCALAQAGLAAMLHDSVFKMARIYKLLRPDFPECERWSDDCFSEKVLICPPSAVRSAAMARFPKRTAMLTGWAVDPRAKYRYGCDAAFPLTDHADYDDLLRYVEVVQPRRVFTVHGFAEEFAADLRRRGIEAWAPGCQNQLELMLA